MQKLICESNIFGIQTAGTRQLIAIYNFVHNEVCLLAEVFNDHLIKLQICIGPLRTRFRHQIFVFDHSGDEMTVFLLPCLLLSIKETIKMQEIKTNFILFCLLTIDDHH